MRIPISHMPHSTYVIGLLLCIVVAIAYVHRVYTCVLILCAVFFRFFFWLLACNEQIVVRVCGGRTRVRSNAEVNITLPPRTLQYATSSLNQLVFIKSQNHKMSCGIWKLTRSFSKRCWHTYETICDNLINKQIFYWCFWDWNWFFFWWIVNGNRNNSVSIVLLDTNHQ